MNIFSEVEKLNFPLGEYIVVGSGIMGAYGLKELKDVDIVATPNLFEKLRKSGEWQEVQWTYLDHTEGIFLRRNNVEVYLDVNCGDENPTTEKLIDSAKVINNIPFINFKQCLRFKKAYSKNKPKHFKDIEIIEKF